jgi:Ca2+-binding EF-hand superfamily protein
MNLPGRKRPMGLWVGLWCGLASGALAFTLPTAAQVRTAFNAVDGDSNARLEGKEWDIASFALFRAADKNNDDFIDRSELASSNLAPDTFLRSDVDRDDRLSVREFTDLRRAIFNTADIDRDEVLTPVEFELLILMERVGWQDANQNSRIEMSELSASLGKAFAELDADRDAALSEKEAAYMRPAIFKLYDTDRDGRLSREEFVQGYRRELIAF